MALSEVDKAGVAYGAIESGQAVMERSRRIFSPRIEFLAGGLLIMAGAFVYPHVTGIADRIGPVCLFHRITGLPCLLCGMTRSLGATANGHLAQAFRFHFLGPPLFLLIAGGVVLVLAEYAFRRPILPRPSRRARVFLAWGTLGLLVAAWVARLAIFGVNV